MAVSNASRGARAKARTKKYLIDRGYQVVDMEKVYWIITPRGRMPVKKDQAGSDLLAFNATDLIFVQAKSGASATGGTFPEARRTFAAFTSKAGPRRRSIPFLDDARVAGLPRTGYVKFFPVLVEMALAVIECLPN